MSTICTNFHYFNFTILRPAEEYLHFYINFDRVENNWLSKTSFLDTDSESFINTYLGLYDPIPTSELFLFEINCLFPPSS